MNRPERIVTAKKNPAQGRGKSSLGQPLEYIPACNCHARQNVVTAHCFGEAACFGNSDASQKTA